MARSTSKLSESEREQRRARDRERLKLAAEQLLTSEGWERWVRVRSRNGLARYSVNNQLLIALARPDATFVAGFRAWLELGYQVRKGEKAIWILAPLTIKKRDRVSGEETGETRTLFRAVPVFDRAQVTAGEHATPLEPPVEPLSGDSHEHLLVPLESVRWLAWVHRLVRDDRRAGRRVVRREAEADRRRRRPACERAGAGSDPRDRACDGRRLSAVFPGAGRGDRRHR